MPPMNLIDRIDKENGKKSLPPVRVGDTVRVHYLIREGDKERIQPYTGTVIAIRGRGIARSLIVRRLVQGEGVERTFPFHSPRVKDIEVVNDTKAVQTVTVEGRPGLRVLPGETSQRQIDSLDAGDHKVTLEGAPFEATVRAEE